MSTTIRQVNPSGTRVFMGTLTGGANVHEALAEVATQLNTQTATFEMLGGLSEVEFSEYSFATQQRNPPLTFKRPLEIIAGHGTISLLDGKPFVHLHLTLSFQDKEMPKGIAVVGGHCARALAFAIEFTLTVYDGAPAQRAKHAGTGLMLWDLPPLADSK